MAISPLAKEPYTVFDILTVFVIFLGFALIMAVGGELGTRSTDQGLFAFKPMAARPRGVQEVDLPPFRFRDPVRPTLAATSGPVAVQRSLEGRAA